MPVASLFERATPSGRGYRDVAPAAVFASRDRVRLIDVREPGELYGELGRVPGSELVPLGTLPMHATGWDLDGEIVLICRSGQRSARAAEQLARRGFRRVMNLAGGMLAYRSAGLPVDHAGGRSS